MTAQQPKPATFRLASGRQLWVLNREGLIRLVEDALEPVSNTEADAAIKRSIALEEEAEKGLSEANG